MFVSCHTQSNHHRDKGWVDLQRDRVFRVEIEPIVGLPRFIIVKQQKAKGGGAKDFECEKEAYSRLQELQGRVIPQYFGDGPFYGILAMFLLEIIGSTLYNVARNKNLGIDTSNLETYSATTRKAKTLK